MKYTKHTDEQKYHQLKVEAEQAVAHVLAGIEALRNEGIPTDQATIEMLTATPDALESYMRDSANSRIGAGFVPPEEKSRIYEVYSHLMGRIKDRFHLMRESLQMVPLLFDGDHVSVDYKKMEKLAKEKATYEIDMEGLSAYYSKVEAIENAMNEMRKYEIEHSLPDFQAQGLSYVENDFYFSVKLADFFRYSPSFESFTKIARRYFTKK